MLDENEICLPVRATIVDVFEVKSGNLEVFCMYTNIFCRMQDALVVIGSDLGIFIYRNLEFENLGFMFLGHFS
jgi:hypothetical protein